MQYSYHYIRCATVQAPEFLSESIKFQSSCFIYWSYDDAELYINCAAQGYAAVSYRNCSSLCDKSLLFNVEYVPQTQLKQI